MTDPRFLSVMRREVEMQCRVALVAWHRVNALVASGPSPLPRVGEAGETTSLESYVTWLADVWASIQAILSSTAQISRSLWPEGTRSERSAVFAPEFRDQLKLPSLPNIESRDVRNAFEHVEGRAPTWFEWALTQFPGRPLAGFAIGDGKPMGPRSMLPSECFRFLNASDWTLRVDREAPLDLRAVIAELEILSQCLGAEQRFFYDRR